MKIFILSLTLLASVSFSGNANHQKTKKSDNSYFCTDCWAYADENESHYGVPGHGDFGAWSAGFEFCNDMLDPCAGQLDPVVIETEKGKE